MDDVYRRALGLWSWYYAATEEFDRTLAGSWLQHDRGTWIPAPRYSTHANRHARKCRARIELAGRDVDDEVWRRARQEALHMTHEQQRALAIQPPEPNRPMPLAPPVRF